MTKKELEIEVLKLKSQGYSKSEVKSILIKSVDLNDYKIIGEKNDYTTNKIGDLYAPKTPIIYTRTNEYNFIPYIINFCKDRFSKLDRRVRNCIGLVWGILQNYYVDFNKNQELFMWAISFDNKTHKISIYIWVIEEIEDYEHPKSKSDDPFFRNKYDRNGLYIEIIRKVNKGVILDDIGKVVNSMKNNDESYIFKYLYANNFYPSGYWWHG